MKRLNRRCCLPVVLILAMCLLLCACAPSAPAQSDESSASAGSTTEAATSQTEGTGEGDEKTTTTQSSETTSTTESGEGAMSTDKAQNETTVATTAQNTTTAGTSKTTAVTTTRMTRPQGKLLSPANGATVSLLTEVQQAFIQQVREYKGVDNIIMRVSGEHSLPNGVELAWETSRSSSLVEISETADFKAPLTLSVEGNRVTVENLKVGTTYYWRVDRCEPSVFHTKDEQPRFIHLENGMNIRDLGGWKTQDGKRIRQGMLYRGCALGDGVLTEKAKFIVKEVLNIRTDLDLRQSSVGVLTESPMGEQVKLVCIPTDGYSAFFVGDRKESCRRIFEFLADESNYPIYFHCAGGADRTGALAFVLEMCLGVSEEDAMLDYELTSLSAYGYRSRYGSQFYDVLAKYGTEADSLNDKVHAFLLDCGITESTIAAVKKILLEDAA